jgi:hypothetical protein
MSSRGHKLCAALCGKPGLLRCGRCENTWYCGTDCQKVHWQSHKGPCKEAAAKKSGGGGEEGGGVHPPASPPSEADSNDCAGGCGEPAELRCSICAGAKYCGQECQKKHWPEHKGPCKIAAALLPVIGNSVVDVDSNILQLKKLSALGNPVAQCRLGLCFFKGSGVAVNLREAVRLYKLAAEAGDAIAAMNLASCYTLGQGTPVDVQRAFKWYSFAAMAGHADAQCNLGTCYMNGVGTCVDQLKGVLFFTRSAEAGHVLAQHYLAAAHYNGQGIPINKHMAIKWWTTAAEAGHKDAAEILSRFPPARVAELLKGASGS